jgi:hypothetical protein
VSKNPAWNAYNEEVRKINDAYESSVKPLRVTLSKELAATEKKFDAKINPLVLEKRTILDGLKEKYSDEVTASEKTRREAMVRAKEVLNAELKAVREKGLAGVVA